MVTSISVPEHACTGRWLRNQIQTQAAIRAPWLCIHIYIRIATHPQIFTAPLSIHEAWATEALRATQIETQHPVTDVFEGS
jgi:hypothetical protein